MTGFLRRVVSCKRLPEHDPEAPPLTSPLLQNAHLSGSFSAPELVHRSNSPVREGSDCPRMKPAGQSRARYLQHLALAFIVGGVLTYSCTSLMGKAGVQLGYLSSHASLLSRQAAAPKPCKDDVVQPPPGFALTPRALGNQTGDALATTDRLIVAARHSDVRPSPCF